MNALTTWLSRKLPQPRWLWPQLGIWFVVIVTFGFLSDYTRAEFRRHPTHQIDVMGPNPALEEYKRVQRAHRNWFWLKTAREAQVQDWLVNRPHLNLYRQYCLAKILAGDIRSPEEIPFNALGGPLTGSVVITKDEARRLILLRERYFATQGDETARFALALSGLWRDNVEDRYTLCSGVENPDWCVQRTEPVSWMQALLDSPRALTLLRGDLSEYPNPLPTLVPLPPEPQVPSTRPLDQIAVAHRNVPRQIPTFWRIYDRVRHPLMIVSLFLILGMHALARELRHPRREPKREEAGRETGYRDAANTCVCTRCGAAHPPQPPAHSTL